MTQITAPHSAATADATTTGPRRRTLVGNAGAIFVLYVVMFATGNDLGYDAEPGAIEDQFDVSETFSQVSAYLGMVFVALFLFYGSAVRGAMRAGGNRTWLGDVMFLGFGALAATLASWVVLDVALWKAVDYGDESAIRALITVSDASFLPLMASMVAIYVGAGLAGLTTRSIPTWLGIVSIVVGVLAPLGPAGFFGAVLLPLWVVAVALTVRLEPSA